MGNSSEGDSVVGIIGGGSAGMSCALWLKYLGLAPLIIERNAALGGQLLNTNRINRWVLGLPGRTGPELSKLYSEHIVEENIHVICNTQLVAVETTAAGYRLILQDADRHQTSMLVQALVIATGIRAVGGEVFSGIPGFGSLDAAGLVGCFPTDHLDAMECLRGKTVAVIGGGDNAHFTVKDVASVAALTYLLIRSSPKAQKIIRQEVNALIEQGRVVEYLETEAFAFRVSVLSPLPFPGSAAILDTISAGETPALPGGGERLPFRQAQDGIEISLNQPGSMTAKINVDKVFMRIGFAPNSEFLNTLGPLADIGTQADGYLCIDSCQRTSLASVYAIGDVAGPGLQSVVTAIAQGAIAARAIAEDISSG